MEDISNQNFFNSVRNKIGAGLVEEGIEALLAFIEEKKMGSPLGDQCRQLRSQYRRLQDERMGGRLPFDAFNAALNNLEYSLYRSCTQLEQELSGETGRSAGTEDLSAPSLNPAQTGMGRLKSGIEKYANNDFGGAIADLKAVLETDPNSVEALFYLGVMREETGFVEEAKALYGQVLELDPEYVRAINNRGVIRLKEEDNAGALQDFNKVLKLDPSLEVAWFNRGLVHMRLKNFAEAQEDLNHVAREGIYLKEVYSLRSLARINLDQFEEAIQDCERAISLDPDNFQHHFNWGLALYYQARYRESIRHISDALQRQPDHLDAFLLRGSAYCMIEEYKKGLPDIEALLKQNPEHSQGYFWLGYIRQQTGDPAGAIEAYNTCIYHDPYFKSAYINRGKICMENDLYEDALENFKTAQQLDPNWEVPPPLIQEAEQKLGRGGMFGGLRKWLNQQK